MIYQQLLLTLILGGFTGLAFSQTDSPENEDAQLASPEKIIESVSITKEEAFYIFSECKQFAIDDEIETEYIDDYVEVCSRELTKAVKTAKHQMNNKKIAPTPSKKNDSNTPKLL